MSESLLRLYAWQLTFRAAYGGRSHRGDRGDRGEGVISAAIAVLIMAFLGAALWAGFKLTLDNTQDRVDSEIDRIGQ